MNSYGLAGSSTLKINGDTLSLSNTATLNISSSFGIVSNQPAITSSWTQLNTGSNVGFRIGTFFNGDLTSSILLAITNTGSFTVMLPGDPGNVFTFNGGITPIWIKGSGSYGLPVVQYSLTGA